MTQALQLLRLQAYVGALEGLVSVIVDQLPNKEQVISQFMSEATSFDELAIGENFTDDELEAFKEAHTRLRHILSAKR